MGWNIQYTRHRDSVSDTHTHMGRESVAAAGVEKSDMVPETNKKKNKSESCVHELCGKTNYSRNWMQTMGRKKPDKRRALHQHIEQVWLLLPSPLPQNVRIPHAFQSNDSWWGWQRCMHACHNTHIYNSEEDRGKKTSDMKPMILFSRNCLLLGHIGIRLRYEIYIESALMRMIFVVSNVAFGLEEKAFPLNISNRR